jgi:Fe2+ transport system protein A
MLVSEVPEGARFRVVKVLTGREVGKRLADMGFTDGAEGEVVRTGLLRDPLQVKIRGYDLMIRRSEAAQIEVELFAAQIEVELLAAQIEVESVSASIEASLEEAAR